MPTAEYHARRVAIPPAASMNSGLSPCGASLKNIFGRPGRLTTDCSAVDNDLLRAYLKTADVGPFRVTGLKPAVDSLTRIFTRVYDEKPELHDAIKTAGMLCVRAIRGSTSSFSIHSWGGAIDLYCGAGVVPLGTPQTHRGVLALYPYFHNEGWYWGAAFSRFDAMHFELAAETVARWKRAGLLP